VSSEEIAALLGVPSTCVDWYESLLFDVRDRIDRPGYIVPEVIERARQQYPHDWTQYGWKLIGYQVGSAALNEVMGLKQLRDRTEFSPALRATTLHVLEDKLREAAQTMTTSDPMSIGRILQSLQADATKSDVFGRNAYEANVAAALAEMKWSVGKRYPDLPGFAEFADCAAELRADEIARIARGETLENAEEIKARKFPPPRSARSEDEQWQ
jgi:hypothetical protein